MLRIFQNLILTPVNFTCSEQLVTAHISLSYNYNLYCMQSLVIVQKNKKKSKDDIHFWALKMTISSNTNIFILCRGCSDFGISKKPQVSGIFCVPENFWIQSLHHESRNLMFLCFFVSQNRRYKNSRIFKTRVLAYRGASNQYLAKILGVTIQMN